MNGESLVKKGRRQQLWTSLQSRLRPTSPSSDAPARSPASPSTLAASIASKSTQKENTLPSSGPSSGQSPAPVHTRCDLLSKALDRLAKSSQEDHTVIQAYIPATSRDADEALSQTLLYAQKLQQTHLDKRWTITFGNKIYIVRERVDKVIGWLNRIKTTGDVLANVDPVHVGLPWAGIRLLIEAAASEGEQLASLLTGCETALYMSNRLKVYTDFLNRLSPTLARDNFETGLVEFYVCILSFLARAIRLYITPTARRMAQSFWKGDEVSGFSTRCDQLGSRLEVEASNCDRHLFEQHLWQTVEEMRRLHTIQESLDRIETQVNRMGTEVSFSQIDDAIRQTYNSGRLRVERLSGRSLPLECCFVNLGIAKHIRDVDNPDRRATPGEISRFSLVARLKIENPPNSDQISLDTLFEQRDQLDGTVSRPTRILIWGRAGMGKTTLCKKIAHEMTNCGLWKNLYDRVVWIPLRRLKRTDARDAVELLQYEFPLTGLGERLSGSLRRLIQDERTLFLLDGLDEVSFALDQDSSGGRILRDLVAGSHVIVTSRPHSTTLFDHKPPDLELETVGFFPQQVQEYVQRIATETRMTENAAQEIRSFIQDRPLVQSLARIPIQLDAICYTWSAEGFPQKHVTMTELYLAIVPSLWKDTIIRLEKKNDGVPITKQQLEDWPSVEDFVQREITLLQDIAFQGLCEEVVDFNVKEIVKLHAARQMLNHTFVHTSFLRASDSSVEVSDRTLHFIHLTFQEFFAAQHFVKHWVSGDALKLPCRSGHTRGSSGVVESVTPESFLRREKYNDRYNIFWRFVIGLLQKEPERELFYKFLSALQGDPIDLIGRTHQRLVIHCLSEVGTDDNDLVAHVRQLEDHCVQWILCESRLKSNWTENPVPRSLVWEPECSDYILQELLTRRETAEEALSALCYRSSISSQLLDKVFCVLSKSRDEIVRVLAIRVIGLFCSSYKKDKLTEVWGNARDASIKNHEATKAWIDTRRLLEPAIEILVSLLESPDPTVRFEAAHALGQQEVLPSKALEALVSLLQRQDQNLDPSIRSGAACALRAQTELPSSVVAALVLLIENKDLNQSIQYEAAYALKDKTSLSSAAADALFPTSRDEDLDQSVQFEAVSEQKALSTNLPVEAVEALVLVSKDDDLDQLLRRRAVYALGEQEVLPRAAIEVLASLLQDPDRSIGSAAVDALEGQVDLPSSASESFVSLLQDEDLDRYVRSKAVFGLWSCAELPTAVIDTLTGLILQPNQDYLLRDAILFLIEHQVDLPDGTIEALVPLLQDPEWSIRTRAAEFIKEQTILSDRVIETLVALLRDADQPVSCEAIDALTGREDTIHLLPTLKSKALHEFVRRWSLTDLGICFFWKDHFCMRRARDPKTVPLDEGQRKSFEAEWLKARTELGLPALTCEIALPARFDRSGAM